MKPCGMERSTGAGRGGETRFWLTLTLTEEERGATLTPLAALAPGTQAARSSELERIAVRSLVMVVVRWAWWLVWVLAVFTLG